MQLSRTRAAAYLKRVAAEEADSIMNLHGKTRLLTCSAAAEQTAFGSTSSQ
jgi:hypothetical protein